MPYFKWVGVDIVGITKKGKQAAHSKHDLSEQLFCSGIALLECKSVYAASFFWAISDWEKSELFKQVATLLQAGLLLPQVLDIVAQQCHNPFLYDMLFSLGEDIKNGTSFAHALRRQKELCDPIVMTMLVAGYESGSLVRAAENAAFFYHTQSLFKKNVRSALAMPLLTFSFFIGIGLFIFVFILPRFADMFFSFQHELPSFTRYMIGISSFMRSWSLVAVIGFMTIIGVGLYYYFNNAGKKIGTTIIMHTPFVGRLVCQHQFGQVLYALSLLITSGIPVVQALAIVHGSVDNYIIKQQCEYLHQELLSGQMLSHTMALSFLFLPEVVAMVRIGEESGTLGKSLESAAKIYRDRLDQSMSRFVFVLQPLVIILLGFLITALIFAVYLPIMQLSHVL
jgi:type IV pilus assembly protein PilC